MSTVEGASQSGAQFTEKSELAVETARTGRIKNTSWSCFTS